MLTYVIGSYMSYINKPGKAFTQHTNNIAFKDKIGNMRAICKVYTYMVHECYYQTVNNWNHWLNLTTSSHPGDQVWSGLVRSGQVRSGLVWSGLVWSYWSRALCKLIKCPIREPGRHAVRSRGYQVLEVPGCWVARALHAPQVRVHSYP